MLLMLMMKVLGMVVVVMTVVVAVQYGRCEEESHQSFW